MARLSRSSMSVLAFPIIIIFAGLLGLVFHEQASALGPAITPLLGVVMFFMGMTIALPDLKILATKPHAVILGAIAQYIIMPLAGLGVGVALQLDPILIVGMVVLGSAPGGASSNIVAYLANGNVALSVCTTAVSTLVAPLMTPLLILWLAGSYVDVSFAAMLKQILTIVLIPVLLGVLVRIVAKRLVSRVSSVIPWLSIAALAVVIAGIMAANAQVLASALGMVFVAVVLHNAFGFALGWAAARLARLGYRERRAISVEVGMQNAGLAAALCHQNFEPMSALPSAVATIWHNVAGALLATGFGVVDSHNHWTNQEKERQKIA